MPETKKYIRRLKRLLQIIGKENILRRFRFKIESIIAGIRIWNFKLELSKDKERCK